ncbi:hypothetical protein, partial [Burkholderia ubonensis]|uniref:hypothetical protein n=1 Tax=Burkholderia ubonensis TaxID=101571 RepID=UPI001C432483
DSDKACGFSSRHLVLSAAKFTTPSKRGERVKAAEMRQGRHPCFRNGADFISFFNSVVHFAFLYNKLVGAHAPYEEANFFFFKNK